MSFVKIKAGNLNGMLQVGQKGVAPEDTTGNCRLVTEEKQFF